MLFAPQVLTEESHPGLPSSVQITWLLFLLTTGLCPSIILKNGFRGDIAPLLEEPSNFHAAVDRPQLNLVKIKT